MPDSTERQELLDAATRLRGATERLAAQFEETDAFACQTRRLTNHLRGAFLVLALVVVALAVTTVRANDANDKATRLQEYQQASCELANESRQDNRDLWDTVLQLLAPPGEKQSPGLRKFTTALKAQVVQTYTPRDCSRVSEGKAG